MRGTRLSLKRSDVLSLVRCRIFKPPSAWKTLSISKEIRAMRNLKRSNGPFRGLHKELDVPEGRLAF